MLTRLTFALSLAALVGALWLAFAPKKCVPEQLFKRPLVIRA